MPSGSNENTSKELCLGGWAPKLNQAELDLNFASHTYQLHYIEFKFLTYASRGW